MSDLELFKAELESRISGEKLSGLSKEYSENVCGDKSTVIDFEAGFREGEARMWELYLRNMLPNIWKSK